MRVLVVEDAARMAAVLAKGLREECFTVEIAEDGPTGLQLAASGDFDLVLLDVNLPGMDGFAVMRHLRERRGDVPVIMVTARDDVRDRVEGLDSGADDYLTKPFSFEELLARIRATMRRPGARAAPRLSHDDIELDPATGRVSVLGKALQLSAREFALLRQFLAHPGAVLTRARLYETVWGTDYDGLSNVLDVYVTYLRKKLAAAGKEQAITTLRGRGYCLGDPP